MKAKILVITPTLGNRNTLAKTIESVREIGGDMVKHIIVAPEQQISFIKETFGDIECLPEQEGKKGIYAALNHGFYTYGKDYEYLTFINDDDYWLPDFKLLINTIEEGYDFVYGKVNYILENKNGEIKPMACSNQFTDFIPLLHHKIILFTQQATLIKSKLYFQLGGFSEEFKLVSDTKFWADLSMLNVKYKYIPKPCAAYIHQDGKLSNKELQTLETIRMVEQMPKSPFLKRYLAVLKFRITNSFVYINRYLKGLSLTCNGDFRPNDTTRNDHP